MPGTPTSPAESSDEETSRASSPTADANVDADATETWSSDEDGYAATELGESASDCEAQVEAEIPPELLQHQPPAKMGACSSSRPRWTSKAIYSPTS